MIGEIPATTSPQNLSCDVVVVGGGLAGSITAYLLTQEGLNVHLLFQSTDSTFKCGESLPPQAMPVIKRLGLNHLLKNGTHKPCPGNQSAFGSEGLIDSDFIFSEHGHGWHIDRSLFEKDVLSFVSENNTKTLQISCVNNITKQRKDWHLSVNNIHNKTMQIQTQFIVDATGRNRSLLKKIGIKTKVYDRLAARCMVFQNPPGLLVTDQRTFIESVKEGWWYSAPIPNNQQLLMYFSDTDLTTYRAMKSVAGFNHAIEKTLHIKTKFKTLKTELNALVQSFTAQTTQAECVADENWLAVGDAAVSYDPLSSQGMWKALTGAEQAVQMIAKVLTGNSRAIESYVKWINQEFYHYQSLFHTYYNQEQRWQQNLFWSRRHSMKN